MTNYFPPISLRSGRCCGPVVGSTGDVRLSFGANVWGMVAMNGAHYLGTNSANLFTAYKNDSDTHIT